MGTIILIIALIILAMVMFLLEVLTPSLGLLAIMGVIALVGATVAGFSIHAALGWSLLAAFIVLTPVYIVMMVKWLPSSALGRRVFLGKAPDGSGEGTPKAAGLEALIGSEGVAATDLRPAGKVRIDGRRIEARAESNMIDRDRPVRVVGATGTEVVVREVEPGDDGQTELHTPAPADPPAPVEDEQ